MPDRTLAGMPCRAQPGGALWAAPPWVSVQPAFPKSDFQGLQSEEQMVDASSRMMACYAASLSVLQSCTEFPAHRVVRYGAVARASQGSWASATTRTSTSCGESTLGDVHSLSALFAVRQMFRSHQQPHNRELVLYGVSLLLRWRSVSIRQSACNGIVCCCGSAQLPWHDESRSVE